MGYGTIGAPSVGKYAFFAGVDRFSLLQRYGLSEPWMGGWFSVVAAHLRGHGAMRSAFMGHSNTSPFLARFGMVLPGSGRVLAV